MNLFAISVSDRWGMINEHAEVVIEPRYEDLLHVGDDRLAFRQNGAYGLINLAEEPICPPSYSRIRHFYDGLAQVENKEELHGFIDRNGKLVIPCRFYDARDFSEGLALVKDTMISKDGFIDTAGEYRISPVWLSASSFREGLAVARPDSKKGIEPSGFINPTGSFVIEPKFKVAHSFFEGLAAVSADKNATRFGFIDRTGTLKIGPHFSGADLRFQ